MKYFESEIGGRVIIIRLNRGDMLLESIKAVIKEERIKDATIVCGYGTLDYCTLHNIETNDVYPAVEAYPHWENYPLELVSMTGVVADGQEHIHVVVSDKGHATGGHLESGCRVVYLAEVVIYEHRNLILKRYPTEWGPLALEEEKIDNK